jgi:hypothetical protein
MRHQSILQNVCVVQVSKSAVPAATARLQNEVTPLIQGSGQKKTFSQQDAAHHM